MRHIAAVFLTGFIICSPAGVASEKCGIPVLQMVHANIDSISDQELNLLFGAYGPSCGANVEFSQWGNELLFEALPKNPDVRSAAGAQTGSGGCGKTLAKIK